MNISGPIGYQSFKFRISDSNLFLGLGLSYTEITNRLDQDTFPGIGENSFKNVGAHLLVDYDTRDNALSPNKGMMFNANIALFDKALGSEYSYQRYIFQELLIIFCDVNQNHLDEYLK